MRGSCRQPTLNEIGNIRLDRHPASRGFAAGAFEACVVDCNCEVGRHCYLPDWFSQPDAEHSCRVLGNPSIHRLRMAPLAGVPAVLLLCLPDVGVEDDALEPG